MKTPTTQSFKIKTQDGFVVEHGEWVYLVKRDYEDDYSENSLCLGICIVRKIILEVQRNDITLADNLPDKESPNLYPSVGFAVERVESPNKHRTVGNLYGELENAIQFAIEDWKFCIETSKTEFTKYITAAENLLEEMIPCKEDSHLQNWPYKPYGKGGWR